MRFLPHVALYLLILSCSSPISLAQQPPIPECAQLCLLRAFGTNACSPVDVECICTSPVFQNNVTQCVTASCTVPDALLAKNASLTTCNAPVRNRGPQYQMLSNAMFSTAAGFVLIRFAYKLSMARIEIGWDDWCALATVLVSIPSAVITDYGTVKYGLGQDIWRLRPDEITNMLRSFYMMAILYFAEVAMLKLCLLFFYLRVFPTKGVKRLLWGTIALSTLWGVLFSLIAVFQCRPISFFWTNWDGLHAGHCIDVNTLTTSHAIISIVLDFWILAIPLWQLRKLQMHWKKKVSVGFMFTIGTFVTVVSCLRLRAVIVFGSTSNPSWDFYDVAIWSTIEICVGIMCACLPSLRQFLARLFPIIRSKHSTLSRKGREDYGSEGSTHELQSVTRTDTDRDLKGVSRDGTYQESKAASHDCIFHEPPSASLQSPYHETRATSLDSPRYYKSQDTIRSDSDHDSTVVASSSCPSVQERTWEDRNDEGIVVKKSYTVQRFQKDGSVVETSFTESCLHDDGSTVKKSYTEQRFNGGVDDDDMSISQKHVEDV